MKKILIVDDNVEQSETVQTNIKLELKKANASIEVITLFPFDSPELYTTFISDNDVCVVILDEKLNDQANSDGETVDYLGHNLVTYLREREKDLPIYTITNYTNDADLQGVFSEYDQVIGRKEFYEYPEKFVPIMIRAAEKFTIRSSKDLSDFNELTVKIAGGDPDPKLLDQLKALQVKLELPFTGFDDRKGWLDEYEKQIKELEALKIQLTQKISGK